MPSDSIMSLIEPRQSKACSIGTSRRERGRKKFNSSWKKKIAVAISARENLLVGHPVKTVSVVTRHHIAECVPSRLVKASSARVQRRRIHVNPACPLLQRVSLCPLDQQPCNPLPLVCRVNRQPLDLRQ